MRAWLLVWAALVAGTAATTAQHHARPHPPHPAHAAHLTHPAHPAHLAHPARLERIKSQILAKLGLSSRPTPLGAPPRDVVRAILARAADSQPPQEPRDEQAMREVIAIAHRGNTLNWTCSHY